MDVVRSLVSAVDALSAADASTLADGESLMALQREHERLTAVLTRATAAFDAVGSWAADGARSSSAWLTARCGLPLATARRQVRLGRDLRHMPVVEAAWLAGDIGQAQVGQLAEARTEATAASFARDEEMLVGQAQSCPTATSAGPWPTGPSTPIPTGPRTRPRPSTRPAACTCRAASTGPGCSTGSSTPSRARS